MLHRLEGADRGRDRRAIHAGVRCRKRGRQHVLHVMTAANGDLAGVHQQLAAEDQLVRAQARTRLRFVPPAEPFHAGGGMRSELHAHRVVGVEDGDVAGAHGLEQPSLGGGVTLEGVVAVQVILRHVEREADVRAKIRNRLQLEAG